jgi:hypothetical protein
MTTTGIWLRCPGAICSAMAVAAHLANPCVALAGKQGSGLAVHRVAGGARGNG